MTARHRREEYLALDFSDPGRTSPALPLDRRQFLKLVGGGIVVLLTVPDSRAIQQEGGPGGRPQLPQDFNAFLRIGEDGRVTGFTGKIEMGQGVITSLAQMLADELAVPLDAVDMVMGDTDLCPWDMGTFGSMTTRIFGPAFRAAAAEAKAVLVELAAEYLQVAKERLKTKDGVVYEDGRAEESHLRRTRQGKEDFAAREGRGTRDAVRLHDHRKTYLEKGQHREGHRPEPSTPEM